MEKRITVRMDDGAPPRILVTTTAEYEHAEQGEVVTATSEVNAEVSEEQADGLRRLLQAILDQNEDRAVKISRRGRIKSEAAALRMAGED